MFFVTDPEEFHADSDKIPEDVPAPATPDEASNCVFVSPGTKCFVFLTVAAFTF